MCDIGRKKSGALEGLDCVTHTDDSDHSTISTLQESDCVIHADNPTVLLGTDPLDDIYYDTVSESDCVTHTDYSTVLSYLALTHWMTSTTIPIPLYLSHQ
jgi:hypothetical protein